MKIQFVDLRAQYASIRREIDAAIGEVVADAGFIGGRRVEDFERAFAEYLGVRHCIGVGNGTDALYIALKALDVGRGDEVITVANSFIATSEAITRTGAKVVFVDCDERTQNIDPGKVAAAVTADTKAIVPVHLYGRPADMDAILGIARQSRLHVIEDAAQAHGARHHGRTVGSIGVAGCFSFYPGKNLGAYGDAGAVVTNDDRLGRFARMYANHGRIDKYDHEIEGINSRLDGMQAAILEVKLRHLAAWNERRNVIAARYHDSWRGLVAVPEPPLQSSHAYHLYVIRVPNRDVVRTRLAENGIATGIHYPVPLPLLKAYRYLGHRPSDFPVADRLKDEILSLPIHDSMTDAEVDYVIDAVRRAVRT